MLVALNAASILLRFGGYNYCQICYICYHICATNWGNLVYINQGFQKKILLLPKECMKIELNLGINTSDRFFVWKNIEHLRNMYYR
jgi:hypothetical protein